MYSCPLVFLYPRSPLQKYQCDVRASARSNKMELPTDSSSFCLDFVGNKALSYHSPSTSTNKQDFFDQYGMSEELRSRLSLALEELKSKTERTESSEARTVPLAEKNGSSKKAKG